jgi:hypothetical protein
LRVLDTAERPQIDQGICHQLHPIVSLRLCLYTAVNSEASREMAIAFR